MAIYSFIYANAKMEGNRKDYHVRVCDQVLREYAETLILLSNRLLSTDRRYGKAERQSCWFSGYIGEKKEIYLVAVGGEQETILGLDLAGGGFRAQHCVLGYGFTDDDVRLYRQEDEIFEPLKEILRQIQQSGKDLESEPEQIQRQHFDKFALHGQQSGKDLESEPEQIQRQDADEVALDEAPPEIDDRYNIIQSTPAADTALWGQSLQSPVMTGIISTDDAKKLLQIFPDGFVSVMENVNLKYTAAWKKEEEKAAEKPVQEISDRKNFDKTEERKLQEYGIFPGENPNNHGENSKREGKNDARPNYKKVRKNEDSLKAFGKTVYGVLDGLVDGLNDRNYRERENLAFVQKYAKFCEEKLTPAQQKNIQTAVKKLHLKKESFSRQMEYYGYMRLWLYKEEEAQPTADEDAIYLMIREWAKLKRTENNVFQDNIQFAKMIKRKGGKNGSI